LPLALECVVDFLAVNLKRRRGLDPDRPALLFAGGINPADAGAHGRAARAFVEQHYSSAVILDAHEKLFRSLIR
jgi:hypothetical protein